MDYKYIEQLMERYWQCATTLEEERILRTFFAQKDVPVELLPYKDLFTYSDESLSDEVLDESFDDRMMALIDEPTQVEARTIRFTERLKPLFKAAAVVAIILTLGNAIQVAFQLHDAGADLSGMAVAERTIDGPSMAKADSTMVDTLAALPAERVFMK